MAYEAIASVDEEALVSEVRKPPRPNGRICHGYGVKVTRLTLGDLLAYTPRGI